MSRPLHIACLQLEPKADFDSALREIILRAETAVNVGSELLAMPEYCGGLETRGGAFTPPAAPEDKHPVLHGLCEYADKRKVWMVVGSIAIEAPNGKIFNRGYVIDDRGKIRSRYDKIHLFDIELSEKNSYKESQLITAGEEAVVTETPFGTIGHTICYDLRFPGLYRDLAQAGAEMLFVPAAFTRQTGQAHWHVLNRARAIENGAFVIAPCAVGSVQGGGESYGHSLIVNPWGEVLADGDTLPGVIHATIDLEMVAKTRSRIPSVTADRDYQLTTGNSTSATHKVTKANFRNDIQQESTNNQQTGRTAA